MRPEDGPPPGSEAAYSVMGEDLGGSVAPDAVRYVPGGELGRGGMGVVTAASDGWLGRQVAVKRPRPDLPEAQRQRMLREARVTARLVHPGIAPIYDVGEDELGPFYTMPVLAGRTLDDRLRSDPVPLGALVGALAAASRALGYAHAHGVVHRDVKPANLLLGDHGEVWVVDWGVAFDAAEPDVAVVGTTGFQAPEQRRGGVVSPATDVYGMGRTLAQVLDARPPGPPELLAIVQRCTQDDPADRYVDGAALADDLTRWLEGQRVWAHAYTLREIAWRRIQAHRGAVLVAVVAVLGLVILAGVSWRAQVEVRARADHNLATSLAQQATSRMALDARPEAEVLAAHALALDDSPMARGVAMQWHGMPRVERVSDRERPCERPFLQDGGQVVCVTDRLTVWDADGREVWTAPYADPERDDGTWPGRVIDARVVPEGLLLHHEGHFLQVWSQGARVAAFEPQAPSIGLASGGLPAVYGAQRIGRIDMATGEVVWEPTLCAGISTALVMPGRVIAGCRDASVSVALDGAAPERWSTPGSPSVLAWADRLVVGTFDAGLWLHDEGGWTPLRADVGAPRQLLNLPGGRLGVLGERGQVRVWSWQEGVLLAALPGTGSALARVGEDLIVRTDRLVRYRLPPSLAPVDFDRREAGGLSYLDVSPSGTHLLAGSASGEVVSWEVATGRSRVLVAPEGHTAKGGAFVTDDLVVFGDAARVVGVRMALSGGAPLSDVAPFPRWSQRVGERVLLAPYAGGGWWVGALGGLEEVEADAALEAVVGPAPLWWLDARGQVFRDGPGGLEPQFEVSTSWRLMARCKDHLVFGGQDGVEVRTAQGELAWRWSSPTTVMALAASDAWIVAGDGDGRVSVLRPDGALAAQVVGHERRVSGVVLHGDVAYTASWDGHVRRWGLAALEGGRVDATAVEQAWGLTLEQALDQPLP